MSETLNADRKAQRLILGPHKQVAICCLNITLNGGKLLLRNRATTICNTASGQMEAIMRAYIVIGTLAVLAVSAGIYTAQRLLGL